MSAGPRSNQQEVTRRGLLSMAAVAAGGIALSPFDPPVQSPAPSPRTTPEVQPTKKPNPSTLRTRDPLLLRSLRKTAPTRGAISRFEGAFPALKVKEVLALPGAIEGPVPWLAVSIVGPVNQLQIISPESEVPVHVLSIPGSHNGGIESLVWHAESKTLYLVTGPGILSWSPSRPKLVHRLGEVPGATALYDLQLDSSGNLWGGTYPSGSTFTYTATTKKIRAHSRLAADTDYARRLAIGPDDRVWVGTGSRNPRLFTFPAAEPGGRTEVQLPDPMKNGFVSSINTIGDRIVVTASDITAELLLDPETKKWNGKVKRPWTSRLASKETTDTGRFYSITNGILYATDVSTWQDTKLGRLSASEPLLIEADSKRVLVASQIPTGLQLEYFTLSSGTVEVVRTVSLTDGEFVIQSLMGHSDGNIYVGGYMGSGLAAVDPDTGARWRSPDDEKLINQIEGMIEFDSQSSFIGSYGSADIIDFENQSRNNPDGYERLARLSRKYHQSRPFGWAANSKNVFFGTVPDYGRTGGVLGMIDPRTKQISWVIDAGGNGFIKAQSIIGLAADEGYVYGTSSVRNGYGIPDTKGAAKVFKMEISTKKKIWETAPISDSGALYAPKLIAGWLLVADIEGINIIDPRNGKLVRRHKLTKSKNSSSRPGWANADIAAVGDGSKVVHSAGGTTTVVDFLAGTKARIGNPDGTHHYGNRLTSTPSGRVFGSTDKTVLVELDLFPLPTQAKKGSSSSSATRAPNSVPKSARERGTPR